jgi:hypothetical protein
MKKQRISVNLFLFSGLFLLTTNLFAQDPNFYIYLCFGQSNMEGQGTIQSQDGTVDGRFKVFQALDCSNLGRTKATWYTASPPTCQCYSKLSPADYFGRTMVANLPDSITIGIINVAIGGCDIRLFDKDIYMDYDSTYAESWFTSKVEAYEWNPYQYLIDLAQLAQQDGVIKGILLHQGETNTGQALWPSYVKKIYNDMLTDLSLSADLVPLLAGEVLSAEGNCCASMNPIINRLPDTIPTAYVISADGCSGQDNAHFDSEGYRKLGRRYGVQMLSIMGYEAVYYEAECGTVGDNWYILADEDASNSAYAASIPGIENTTAYPADAESKIQMNVSVSADTNYYIYGRFNNPGAEAEAYWIKIDDVEFGKIDIQTTSGWEWIKIIGLMDWTAGEHTISIAIAEDGVLLDKLVLKNTESLPVDIGEEAVNLCEADPVTGIIDVTRKGYALKQNYPNPGSESHTNISFEIPNSTYVSLKIVNMQGVVIDELAGKEYKSGEHIVAFDHDKLSPGIYFYTMQTDKFSATRKMIIPTE